jgi:hypothetical protein
VKIRFTGPLTPIVNSLSIWIFDLMRRTSRLSHRPAGRSASPEDITSKRTTPGWAANIREPRRTIGARLGSLPIWPI